MSTIIYGASDDLIIVEGAFSDEFPADPDGNYVALSNGVLLHIELDGAEAWRIRTVGGHDSVRLTPARGDGEPDDIDGCPGYSDKATVEGVTWVVCGTSCARAPRDLRG